MPRHPSPVLAGLVGLLLSCSAGCSDPPVPRAAPKRTLAEARQIALDLFRELDGFELVKQREVGLAGRPAVRMEARWRHAGQDMRGIIYVIDNPSLFNVIHFTSPADPDVFDVGYPVFTEMIKSLKVIRHAGSMAVEQQADHKVLESADLQLQIRYPNDWGYSLDEINRALVFSGPRDDPTWLTTISFSLIHKWAPQGG